MKFLVAALSAFLAVASAVPIFDVMPVQKSGIMGGYGDIMDVYKTIKYMGGDMMGVTGIYNPMYKWWAGLEGMHNAGMGMYGPYSPLYDHYGFMGMGNDLHHSTGIYDDNMVDDMYMRKMTDPMFYKSGWNTVDKMMCYHTYGIETCHMMMMRKMMPHMMMPNMMY